MGEEARPGHLEVGFPWQMRLTSSERMLALVGKEQGGPEPLAAPSSPKGWQRRAAPPQHEPALYPRMQR